MIENIRLSIKGVKSHGMRSALTMLGIIIGIASIIIIVSIINGTSEQLKDSMINSGDGTITLGLYSKSNPWNTLDPIEMGKPEGVELVSEDTVDKIEELDGVLRATPVYSSSYGVGVSYNGKTQSADVMGVDIDYFGVTNLVLTSGRFFIDRDYNEHHNVAVITSDVANSMFENESALGKTITLNTEMYTVVGVVTVVKDYSDIENLYDYNVKFGYSEAGKIIVPSTSWVNFGGFEGFQTVIVKVESADDTVKVGAAAAAILNESITNMSYEYKSSSLEQDAESLDTITSILSVLLIGVASISLLVGGIGVMNIMLVSVTERTKEIGLKKALGAKKRVILGQFLTESVVLTSMGGVFGVLLGIGISYLISFVLQMPASISVTAVAIAVGFSMGVGIIFGITPSIKAANLNPIDALRYE